MTDAGRGRQGERHGRPRPSPQERRQERSRVEDPAVVLEAAARFLQARARSVQEVRRRLTQAGYQPGVVDGVLTRLVELGMLDDAAFARAWVESRDRARPRGARILRLELRQKGIAPEIVDEVLAERDGEGGEDGEAGAQPLVAPAFGQLRVGPATAADGGERADAAGARRLLARHAAALARVTDPRKRRQRAFALLARNGFDLDLIGSLVGELGAGQAEGRTELVENGDAPGDSQA